MNEDSGSEYLPKGGAEGSESNHRNDAIRIGDHVTLRRRGKRQIWVADFHYCDANGKRQHGRRSLKTRNRKIADPLAWLLEEELASGTYKAGSKAKSSPQNESSFDSAIEQFVASKRADGCAPKTLAKYSQVPRDFAEFVKETQSITAPRGVTLRHLDQYRQHRADIDKIDPYTLYTLMTVLKTFFQWCLKRQIISADPTAQMESKKPRRRRHPAATLEQVDAVLARAGGWLFAVMATLAFTGLRVGELANLRPQDVDLTGATIHVRRRQDWAPKNVGAEREVPIHPRLLAILTAMERPRSSFFFTAPPSLKFPDGDHHVNYRDANELFQRIAKECGFPIGRKERGLTQHALRRFFKTFALDAGVPKPLVDRWLGHEDQDDMDFFYYDPQRSKEWMVRVPFGAPSDQDVQRLKQKPVSKPPADAEA